MVKTAQGTLWVCVDCLMSEANGEEITPRDGQPEPWSREPDTDVTMGLAWSEHQIPAQCEELFTTGGECYCETREFSWSSCDGCGSTLGGSRHAYTYWGE